MRAQASLVGIRTGSCHLSYVVIISANQTQQNRVGRSVTPQVGPGHRYLTGPGPGRGLRHGRIQRAKGTGVSVGRYIRLVRWSSSRCLGDNRARRESGASNVS